MLAQTRSQREEYQKIIARKKQDSLNWFNHNLDESEEFSAELANDGLGVRVGVRSLRAKKLISDLHRDVFAPSFAAPSMLLEQGVWTAWFGYSEPFEPPTYYSVG